MLQDRPTPGLLRSFYSVAYSHRYVSFIFSAYIFTVYYRHFSPSYRSRFFLLSVKRANVANVIATKLRVVRRSPFVVCRSPFVVCRSSLVVRRCFILDPRSSTRGPRFFILDHRFRCSRCRRWSNRESVSPYRCTAKTATGCALSATVTNSWLFLFPIGLYFP